MIKWYKVGMANIFFISGVGFHLYVFLWQWHVGGSVKQKLKTFLTGESTVNMTGMLLHLFTLYFTCQELAVHKSDLHFSDTSGGHSRYEIVKTTIKFIYSVNR